MLNTYSSPISAFVLCLVFLNLYGSNNTVCLFLLCEGAFNDVEIMNCVAIETSPEQQHHQQQQRSSEVHSKKTVLIKTIETRDGEVT